MAVIIPPAFTPPPLAPPTAPVAERAEALQRRVAFEQIRATALGDIERAQRLQRLQEAFIVPPRISPTREELERVETITRQELPDIRPVSERVAAEVARLGVRERFVVPERPRVPPTAPTREIPPIVREAPVSVPDERESVLERLEPFRGKVPIGGIVRQTTDPETGTLRWVTVKEPTLIDHPAAGFQVGEAIRQGVVTIPEVRNVFGLTSSQVRTILAGPAEEELAIRPGEIFTAGQQQAITELGREGLFDLDTGSLIISEDLTPKQTTLLETVLSPEGLREARQRLAEVQVRRVDGVPTSVPERVPEPGDITVAEEPAVLARTEAVRLLKEFAPSIDPKVAERLVDRGPEALERFVSAQLAEAPREVREARGVIAQRLQTLSEAGELIDVPKTPEAASAVFENIKEFALDIAPFIGDKRAIDSMTQNWDDLSTWDKVFGTTLTALGIAGTATIVAGPSLKLITKLKKSPGQVRVHQSLSTSEADEAANYLRTTVGSRMDAADAVRAAARDLEVLENELIALRAPTGETMVHTQFAKQQIRAIPDAHNIPEAIARANARIEEAKKTPIIQQRPQDLETLTEMQSRLAGLTEDLMRGQKTPVEFRLSASTSTREQGKIKEALEKITETPGSVKGTERIVIEAPATPSGVEGLVQTDKVIKEVAATLPRDTRRLLDRKLDAELVIETGGPSAKSFRESIRGLRDVRGTSTVESTVTELRRDAGNLITSKNPRADGDRILSRVESLRRTGELNPEALESVNRLRTEVASFARQQQEAIERAQEIVNTLVDAGVNKINLRAVISADSSPDDLTSLAKFLIQGRKEGKDLSQLIRVKQARGEDITDLLAQQRAFDTKVQEEVANLTRTFGTEDPEATRRFAELIRDGLEQSRIVTRLELDELGAIRPLSELELRELENLRAVYKELQEAATIPGPRGIRTRARTGPEAEALKEFEETALPRLRELEVRPTTVVDPDIKSIRLEPESMGAVGVAGVDIPPSPFFRPDVPFERGYGVTTTRRMDPGVTVIDRPVVGTTRPTLEIQTTLRTILGKEMIIPVGIRPTTAITIAPERPAPTVEPEVAPVPSPNGVPEVLPDEPRIRPDPRRVVPSPRRVAPEPDIDIPEAPPTPRREVPPVREPFVVPVPEREPVPEVPPGFIPIPVPPAIPGVRVVPSPLGLPIIEPELEPGLTEIVSPEPVTRVEPETEPVGPRVVPRVRPRVRPAERPGIIARPEPFTLPIPGTLIQPEVEPFVTTEPLPEVFIRPEPLVVPEPEIVPEPRPDEPPKPPRIRVPTRPRVPPRPRPRPERVIVPGEEELREVVRPGRPRAQGVAWKQGEIWVSIMPPFGEDNIFHSRNPLPQTRRVRNPRQAFKFIEDRLGHVPAETYDEWAAWFAARPPEEDITVL